MSRFTRALALLGFKRSEGDRYRWMPAWRAARAMGVTARRAITLSTVYRAVAIHATAALQLSLGVWRNGEQLTLRTGIAVRPDLDTSASAFYEYVVTSLYLDGNSFWRLTLADPTATRPGEVVDIKPLNPAEVHVYRDPHTDALTYSYRGETIPTNQIKHLKLLRIPGMERGLGPVQAAQIELAGALDARDYGNSWLSESNQPDAILTTDQELKPGDAEKYRNVWEGKNPDGTEITDADGNPVAKNRFNRLRVLGKGLTYTPLMLKPADLQFLETQKFNTTSIARLFGVPASLMLAAVEGKSQTYSNVEQDWIAYVRFELMRALREIEEAISDLLPHGQVARFKLEALLRTDTKTRYEGHAIALDPVSGWMTKDEVRALEGLAPLTVEQLAQFAANQKDAAHAAVA
jgi:HK97 family phage portal protein